MKNITNIEKTTIAKITAKITTTALLFFLALFTLTTNLKAQAVQDNSKSGFFAGFVYLQGFQVDSSKSISGSTVTTSYEVTGISDTTRIEVTYLNENLTNTAIREGISALFSANCETGAASVESSGTYRFNTDSFESFDPGRKPTLEQLVSSENDATVTFNHIYQLDDGTMTTDHFRTGSENAHTSHCFRHFYGDLSSDRTAFVFDDYSVSGDSQEQVAAASSSTESDKLSGIGLQFGYRWEKWRASFTHYTGQGGDNELTNSLVIADYFFQEKFFVGAGLASMQLTNSSSGSSLSASATSPVLQVGYTENLTKNLQLSIGVLQYSSGLSLSSTTPTTTTPTSTPFGSVTQTATNEGDSATLGSTGSFIAIPGGSTISLGYDSFGGENGDRRIEVTQVGERTVNIQKTVTPAGGGGATIEAELKAPTVISISFHLSF